MTDIEFIDNAAQGGPEPDVPRRRPPRRTWWIVAAVVVAALVVVVVVQGGDGPHPAAQPSGSAGVTTSAATRAGSAGPIGPPVTGDLPALDVVAAVGRQWVLHARSLVRLEPGRPEASLPLPGPELVSEDHDRQARLLLDADARRLWVVFLGSGRVFAIDALTMRIELTAVTAAPVTAVAAMDGDLFLVYPDRIADVSAHDSYRDVVVDTDSLAAIAPDPSRHRLLATDTGDTTRIWVVSPHPERAPTVRRGSTVRMASGAIGVVDGAIWIGGADNGFGGLLRLRPDTLLPTGRGAIVASAGVHLVAVGLRSLWVRPVGDENRLDCVDGVDGHTLQSWFLAGPVASAPQDALVATARGAVPLRLSSCPG